MLYDDVHHDAQCLYSCKRKANMPQAFSKLIGGGDTVPVPGWTRISEEDQRLESYAIHMAALRKEQETELMAIDAPLKGKEI